MALIFCLEEEIERRAVADAAINGTGIKRKTRKAFLLSALLAKCRELMDGGRLSERDESELRQLITAVTAVFDERK